MSLKYITYENISNQYITMQDAPVFGDGLEITDNGEILSATSSGIFKYNSDGNLDTSFGTNGYYEYQSNIQLHSIYNQNDGKILLTGYINYSELFINEVFLSRLTSDGLLDPSFANNGTFTQYIEGAIPYESKQTENGNIVVASKLAAGDLVALQLIENGSIDKNFGNAGIAFSGIEAESVNSICLQRDGKILVGGSIFQNSTAGDLLLVRYLKNGILDTSFGSNGVVKLDSGSNFDRIKQIMVQDDGKIVVTGIGGTESEPDFLLERFNSNGSIDTSFGNSGKTFIDFGGDGGAYLNDAILTPNGKIITIGKSYFNDIDSDIAISKFNTDGSLDVSFGINGKVTTDIGSLNEEGVSIELQDDEKLIVLARVFAQASEYSNPFSVLLRYNSDGTLDTSFQPSAQPKLVNGSEGNDLLYNSDNNDEINGQGGIDKLIYTSTLSKHSILKTDNGYFISINDTTDLITNVERIQFSDINIALDLENGQSASNTLKIIGAAFGANYINEFPSYVGIGLEWFDSGLTMLEVCNVVSNLKFFSEMTDEYYIQTLYHNVTNVMPSNDQIEPFIYMLNNGTTKGELLMLAAETQVNTDSINLIGYQQTGVEYL